MVICNHDNMVFCLGYLSLSWRSYFTISAGKEEQNSLDTPHTHILPAHSDW